jgi:hypothetical protein
MNREINIEVNGIQKPLADVNKLMKAVDDLENGFSDLTKTTDKIGGDLAKGFKELEGAVKETSKNIKDDLQKSMGSVEGIGVKLTKTLKEGFKQIDLSSLESLDTFFDREVEFRDKMINLANVAGNVAEAFGPIGKAISFAFQLAAPVFADFMDELRKADREAFRASQLPKALKKYERELKDELDEVIIKYRVLDKQSEELKKTRIDLVKATAQLEAAEYKLGESFGAELSEMNGIYDAMTNVNLSLDERANAIEQFMSTYGNYLSDLDREKRTLKDIIALYEENVAAMLKKDITSKFEPQLKAISVAMMAAAKEAVEAQRKLDEMDAAGPFSKGLGRDGKSYEQWKEKLDAANAKILEAKNEEAKIREKIREETVSYGQALGLTVTINGQNKKLAYEQYSATKSRRMEEERITKEKAKQRAIYYEERSKKTTEDFEKALGEGKFDEAEKALNKRRAQQLSYINRIKRDKLDMGALDDKIKEAEERIEEYEEKYVETVNKRRVDLEKLGLSGITTLYPDILGIDATNVPKEFKTTIIDQTTKTTKEAIRKFITTSGKDFEEAKKDYERIVSDYLQSGSLDEEELFKKLRQAGIISVFEAIAKKDKEGLTKALDQERSNIEKYQKAKEEGQIDLIELQEEYDKKYNEDLKKLTDARIKQQEKTEEAARKIQAATNLLTGSLGKITLENYIKEIEDQKEVEIRDVLKQAEEELGYLNKFGELLVTFSGGGISVGDLKQLVEQNKITEKVYESAIELASNFNNQIAAINEQREKLLKEAPITFAENAFEFIKADLERTMRSLDVDIESGLLKWEARFDQAVIDKEKAIEKRGKLTGKALKKAKEESKRLLNELESIKQAEIAKVGGIYLEKLEEVSKSGGDVTLILKELNLEIVKVIDKYAEMEKKAKELIPKKKEYTVDNYVEIANEVTNAFMSIGRGFGDYLNMLSNSLIESLRGNLAQIDSEISNSTSRLASLENDLQGKVSGRRDAVLAAIELEKQRNEELQKSKIALEAQLLKEQEKAARRRKAMAITEAVINGALGIMQIWASKSVLPSPAAEIVKGVNTAALATTTALQVATISAQKFAKGGFTGNGTVKDETGYKVAGVVHEGEWVAPKWMVNSPSFKGIISSLEASRQRGSTTLGAPSTDVIDGISASLNPNSDVIRQMKTYTEAVIKLSNRPVIADVKEFSNVASGMYKRMKINTIG